jgi:dephospho-CoA kinase
MDDTWGGKPVLCLIGGIGSGKSRVAAELERRGGRVVSGDQLGHEALRQEEIRRQVVGRWGTKVLDEHGEVSRKALGTIVFADPTERRDLEELVFPWIGRQLEAAVAAAKEDPAVRFVVVDAAVILEAEWNRSCDRIVYVHAPRAVRLKRLAQRGWTEEGADARARVQLPLAEKVSRAHEVVDNSGSLEELGRQLDELLGRLSIAPAR